MPSASLCVRKLSQHQFNANVEFVTRATRLARVIFLGSRELSTIDGNNHPFHLIRRIQAGVVLGFHGIIGITLNLIAIIGTLSKNVLRPKVCNINLIENDPPPSPLELFGKIVRFGTLTRPKMSPIFCSHDIVKETQYKQKTTTTPVANLTITSLLFCVHGICNVTGSKQHHYK